MLTVVWLSTTRTRRCRQRLRHIESEAIQGVLQVDSSRRKQEILVLHLYARGIDIRVRLQLIRHFKTCTTDIYLHNECAHVGLSVDAPVYIDLSGG